MGNILIRSRGTDSHQRTYSWDGSCHDEFMSLYHKGYIQGCKAIF